MHTNLTSVSQTRSTVVSRYPRLDLTTQFAIASDDIPGIAQFRRWVKAALIEDVEVTLRVVDLEEGLLLNSTYRQRHYATNVLTFVYTQSRPVCGDIVLCLPVIQEEALGQHKSLEAHLAHLTIHGILHLQGFDHETDNDAELMEGLETEILASLGYPEPYADRRE